jgi:hypothetical protein
MNHRLAAFAAAACFAVAVAVVYFAWKDARAPKPPAPPAPSADAPPAVATLLFAGDVALPPEGADWDAFAPRLARVAPAWEAADLTVASVACALGQYGPGEALAAPAGFATALRGAGLDVAVADGVAGKTAREGTRGILGDAEIETVGTGGEALVKDVGGIRVGFVAFADAEQAPLDEGIAAEALAAVKAEADVAVALVKWGFPEDEQPTQRQKELGKRLVEAGADLVLGFGPRPDQGAEAVGDAVVVYAAGWPVFRPGSPFPISYASQYRVEVTKEGVRQAWRTQVETRRDAATPTPVSVEEPVKK